MKRIAQFLIVLSFSFSASAQTPPKRPPISGIAHARFYASNLEKTSEFYTKIIGLPSGELGCTGLKRPCFPVNLHQQVELTPATSPAPSNWLAEVAFSTPDVAQLRRYLLALGVSVSAISTDGNGAQHFELVDPQGVPVAFVQQQIRKFDYESSPEQVGSRMIHVGFVVRDRVAEDRFYQDILGFRLYWHGGMKDVAPSAAALPTDIDWVALQVPDGTDWIEYMLNVGPNADHEELGVMNHFSMGVVTMKPAYERLRAHGLKTTDTPEIGRDGKWQFDIFDPDATRVEFMEFTPTQKPCCNPFTGPHPKP